MCYTDKMINNRAAKIEELNAQIEELTKKRDAIRKELEKELTERDTDTIQTERYLIRWSQFITNRFDTKRFRQDHEALAIAYMIPNTQRRFSITAAH